MNLSTSEKYLVASALDDFLIKQMKAWAVARDHGFKPENFNIPQAIELLIKTEEGCYSQAVAALTGSLEEGMPLEEAIKIALKEEAGLRDV